MALFTNQDIIKDALFRAGEAVDGGSDFHAQAVSDYNRVYQSICSGGSELIPDVDESWVWLRKAQPGVLILQPAFVGTANLTFNSAAVVLTNPPVYSLVNWFLQLSDKSSDVFRVATHVAGDVNLTLDSVYTGATLANGSIRAVQLEYDLAADLRSILGPMKGYHDQGFDVNGCDIANLLTDFPTDNLEQGSPSLFAMITEQRVRFNRYPSDNAGDLIRLEYNYMVIPTDVGFDANQPLVPKQYRRILSDFLTFFVMQNKNDPRADAMFGLAKTGLMAMAMENRSRLEKAGNRFGQLDPRQDQLKNWRKIPRSTSGYYYPR